MDVNFIYYKELLLLDENIFSANLSQNNEIEEISLGKSNQHMITNLKINQNTDLIEISNEQLSNAIDAIAQKSKNVCFRCVIERKNIFFTAVEFEKQDDVKKPTFMYKDEKHEEKTVEFYGYYMTS